MLARRASKVKSTLTGASITAVNLSPDTTSKDAHKIVSLDTNSVQHSRNCTFFPAIFPCNKMSTPATSALSPLDLQQLDGDVDPVSSATTLRATASISAHHTRNPYGVLRDLDNDPRPKRITAQPPEGYTPGAHEAQKRADRAKAARLATAAAAAANHDSDDTSGESDSDDMAQIVTRTEPEPLTFAAALRQKPVD